MLAARPKQIFTREQIIEKIWGYYYEEMNATVDVHIKRLRQRLKKLNATLTIETVRGQGYKVENHVSKHSMLELRFIPLRLFYLVH